MSKIFKYFLIGILVSTVIIFWGVLVLLQKTSVILGKPSNYLLDTFSSINKNNPYLNNEKINFILLGLDKRDDLLEKTNTTDTIMFVSLNLKNQKINTISIPRDLWYYNLNSKVNEIYPLSLSKQNQLEFIRESFSTLIGQPISHVVVLSTENLIKFVNLIGGVDVNLEKGFIDTQYPNPEYIKNPSSNISKYKTVEFKSGPVHLDEANITEFVRSRKGSDFVSDGGTDLARIQRQQLLVESILNKVKSGQFINKKLNIIDLYKFWDQEIIKDLSDKNILQIFTLLGDSLPKIDLNKIEIPIGTSPKNGVIYHPTNFINKQWVFVPSDKDYKSFKQFISDSI